MKRARPKRAYPALGVPTWRVWLSLNGVHHLVFVKSGHCATCGAANHKGKKETRDVTA